MIYLLSKPQRVTKVLKTTNAQFFKDVTEGTVLTFSVPLESPGRGGRRGRGGILWATYVTVTNIETKTTIKASLTQLSSILANYEIEEL